LFSGEKDSAAGTLGPIQNRPIPFNGFERGVRASCWLGSRKHAAPVIIIVLWAYVTLDDHSGL
jgi:hypothetical protein